MELVTVYSDFKAHIEATFSVTEFQTAIRFGVFGSYSHAKQTVTIEPSVEISITEAMPSIAVAGGIDTDVMTARLQSLIEYIPED